MDLTLQSITADVAIPFALALNYVAAVAAACSVLLSTKASQSKVLWLAVLASLPLAGLVLFLFFGLDRPTLRRKRRKEHADQRVQAELAAYYHSAKPSPATTRALRALAGPGLFELGVAVGGGALLPGHTLSLHEDARALEAMIEAIAAAERSVNVDFYQIENDEAGRRFRDALVERARAGCRVRVLCDAVGSYWTFRSYFRPIVAAGGEVAQFVGFRPLRGRWQVNFRNHRKILVVDGRVAFTGGVNIGDIYQGKGLDPPRWHDLLLRIEGPAVRELQEVFLEDWCFATGEAEVGAADLPELEPGGPHAVQVVSGDPDRRRGTLHDLFFAAFASARRSIRIVCPYFIPSDAILAALRTAAMRGVDVRIILPRFVQPRMVLLATRSYYEALLEAGVRIDELQDAYLHAKYATVDGEWCTIGSANLDSRSFFLSFETNAVVLGAPFVSQVEALFDRTLARSREVRLDEVRAWSIPRRLVHGAFSLLTPIL